MSQGWNRVVVAVDGPSGSGKSSVSRETANRLGFELLDTGAAYRALAWFALESGIDLNDPAAIVGLLPAFVRDYSIALDPHERWVRVGQTDVSEAIRETSISASVSKVARVPEVREALNALFREVLRDGAAPGIIAEGRDITTVVAPDAPVRILLTADEGVRIARRHAEKAGEDAAAVAASVSQRDAQDARVVDFLTAADGVTELDSTNLDYEATVRAMIEIIQSAPSREAQR